MRGGYIYALFCEADNALSCTFQTSCALFAMNAWLCTRTLLYAFLAPTSPLSPRLCVADYALRAMRCSRWPVLILVLTTPCLLPNTFSVCAREFFDQLTFSQPVLSEPVSVFILTGTIACFTVANLIICLHRCLASGGWAGLSTTLRSFCSWPTLQRAARPAGITCGIQATSATDFLSDDGFWNGRELTADPIESFPQ